MKGMTFLQPTPDGCALNLRVHPGARHNAITGTHAGALKISLAAPPADGRANEALIAFLAKSLRIPRARIALVSGTASRNKTVRIVGLNAEEARTMLDASLAGDC